MGDIFVEIAEKKPKNTGREKYMIEPRPIEYEKKCCALETTEAEPYITDKKMDTKEELQKEVARLRSKFAPFLENHSPTLKTKREKIDITDFILDGSDKVKIPYYSGPCGDATQVYETEFELSDFSGKAAYICFKGADYIATVYINDACVGIHEGFFSPFEFEITSFAKVGKNKLKVVLQNDFNYMGTTRASHDDPNIFEGDKLYAMTGIGYDDPLHGWHHCPPGMGIYDKVYVEIRGKMNITDMFARPILKDRIAELWVEVENTEYTNTPLKLDVSLYGQNFNQTVCEHILYEPTTGEMDLIPHHGKNIYKIRLCIPEPKIWDIDTPYLYQAHVAVIFGEEVLDAKAVTFGMRSFEQDIENSPKGMFYLNGRAIRLRGANTMGFEQLDVMREDFDQLINDILIAKACNMNFWRLTQRPVQDEVYQYCDMLGFMTQTDLPLFSVVRRTKVAEVIRQAEEMAKIVRKHPSNIMVTYMNEPDLNEAELYTHSSDRIRPGIHRHLNRKEMEDCFVACDYIVKLNHPDCVIKHIDGDCIAPDLSGKNCMPDNHCYTLWYYGHAIPINKLYKGYWQYVLPDWYYSCGEYGAEGLESVDFMTRRYPKEWMKEPFCPKNIVRAQTFNAHRSLYDTPDSAEEWVEASQNYQAWATKIMTEAFRRDPRMASIAIHLFIDAWPAGWLKSIMDCERTPKKAFFAYRDAIKPIMVSLRSDRFSYYEGEKVSIETYVCNDTNDLGRDCEMIFELYDGDKMIMQKKENVDFEANTCTYISNAEFIAQHVGDRKTFTLKAILVKDGVCLDYNLFDVEVFEKQEILPANENVVLITDLSLGEHEIAGETVNVQAQADGSDMLKFFVSRKTGHKVVEEFREFDFSMWYDKNEDMIMPIAPKRFTAEGFTPILISYGNFDDSMVAGVKEYEGKKYVISFLDTRTENPVAQRFLNNLNKLL